MPNAKDIEERGTHRIILAGRTGSGKTAQILTLPGKVFVYIFDPNSLGTLRGHDIEYELFLPEHTELDATLKGFNKGSKDDKPASAREPFLYMNWIKDLNEREEELNTYDWVCFDSLTFLVQSIMDRQLFINDRYGKVEDLGDFRVVGSKVSDVFRSIYAIEPNILCTAHIDTYQDEKTKRLETQLRLPGKSRVMIPIGSSSVFHTLAPTDTEGGYQIQTKPTRQGLQDLRTDIKGLSQFEDVTISDFERPQDFGLGKLLKEH